MSREHEHLSDFHLADLLGLAKAASALAKKREEALLDEIHARYPEGAAALAGGYYDVSVALVPGKESLDKAYVKAHMHPNAYRHAVIVGDPFLSVKCCAKKRKAA